MTFKNLLIVGGSGSIGIQLVKQLNFKGKIFIIDKKSPTEITHSSKFLKCDITNTNSLSKIVHMLPNDLLVLYLAGNLSNSTEPKKLKKILNDNIMGVGNFIASLSSKIKHFIFISSISVYGIPRYNPIDEMHPIMPNTIYGCSKASAEIICQTLCNNFLIPYTIIRTAQLFGVSSAQNSLPHILLNKIKSEKIVKISCDPNYKRDYLHISDFIKCINLVLKSPKNGIFNLGSGRGIKISNLFKLAYGSHGHPFKLENFLKSKLEPSFSQIMDINKINKIYEFKPDYNIESWFAKNLE